MSEKIRRKNQEAREKIVNLFTGTVVKVEFLDCFPDDPSVIDDITLVYEDGRKIHLESVGWEAEGIEVKELVP